MKSKIDELKEIVKKNKQVFDVNEIAEHVILIKDNKWLSKYLYSLQAESELQGITEGISIAKKIVEDEIKRRYLIDRKKGLGTGMFWENLRLELLKKLDEVKQ